METPWLMFVGLKATLASIDRQIIWICLEDIHVLKHLTQQLESIYNMEKSPIIRNTSEKRELEKGKTGR